MSNIKPTLVLVIITTVISALLIFTYKFTYVDNSNVITDTLEKCCTEAMGKGEFKIVTDWLSAGYSIEKPENIEKLIRKSDGTLAFEIITSGYTKEGLDLLIALNNDGTVKGISFVAISETPGLGTKVTDNGFISQFIGINSAVLAGAGGGFYKGDSDANTNTDATGIAAVTSATYSSKGVITAVNIATSTFQKMGGTK